MVFSNFEQLLLFFHRPHPAVFISNICVTRHFSLVKLLISQVDAAIHGNIHTNWVAIKGTCISRGLVQNILESSTSAIITSLWKIKLPHTGNVMTPSPFYRSWAARFCQGVPPKIKAQETYFESSSNGTRVTKKIHRLKPVEVHLRVTKP